MFIISRLSFQKVPRASKTPVCPALISVHWAKLQGPILAAPTKAELPLVTKLKKKKYKYSNVWFWVNLQWGEFWGDQFREVRTEDILEHGLGHRHDGHSTCCSPLLKIISSKKLFYEQLYQVGVPRILYSLPEGHTV